MNTGAVGTAALRRELRLLGNVDVPQASLERVWLRVLSECTTGKAGVPETNPAQGRACAARPVTPFTPGLRAGTAFPGLAPVSPPATAPAPTFTVGAGGGSGADA